MHLNLVKVWLNTNFPDKTWLMICLLSESNVSSAPRAACVTRIRALMWIWPRKVGSIPAQHLHIKLVNRLRVERGLGYLWLVNAGPQSPLIGQWAMLSMMRVSKSQHSISCSLHPWYGAQWWGWWFCIREKTLQLCSNRLRSQLYNYKYKDGCCWNSG